MRKVIPVFVALLLALGVIAYLKGWFGVTKDEQGKHHVTFNKEKFKADANKAKAFLADEKKKAAEKIALYKEKIKTAAGDEKAKLEKELEELTKHDKKLDDLKKELEELESKEDLTEEEQKKVDALHEKIAELEKAHKDSDKKDGEKK